MPFEKYKCISSKMNVKIRECVFSCLSLISKESFPCMMRGNDTIVHEVAAMRVALLIDLLI